MPPVIPVVQNLQYRRIVEDIDRAFEVHQSLAAGTCACRRACTACCYGPFDVGSPDLWLLLEGLAALDAEQRRPLLRRIRETADAERAVLETLGVDTASSTPALDWMDEDVFDAMCDARVDAPCPLLDDDGACSLYDARPEPCRYRGATWVDDGETLEMGCPVGLNDAAPPARGTYIDVSARIARLETRSYGAVDGERARTTIALGLDALLRS